MREIEVTYKVTKTFKVDDKHPWILDSDEDNSPLDLAVEDFSNLPELFWETEWDTYQVDLFDTETEEGAIIWPEFENPF